MEKGNAAGMTADGATRETEAMQTYPHDSPPSSGRKAAMIFTLPPCPTAGTGVHGWTLSAANRCHRANIPQHEAERMIREAMTRPPKPASEVSGAVAKAYRSTPSARPWTPAGGGCRAPKPITAITFDPAKLHAIAGKITPPVNWRHWLWERSPKRPEAMSPFGFLKFIFRPGEKALVFDHMESKTPMATVHIDDPMDCTTPPAITNGGNGAGIWYLSNPVDGDWHPTESGVSCRSAAAITAFRFAVLESDEANADDWFALLAQLPLPITAIYTSGSRSIHALARIDAGSKEQWDSIVAPHKRRLRELGADSAALSAVRLTRLPGCRRPEKQGFQRLLYLNPDATTAPLLDMPVIEIRNAALARWREVCPRWKGAPAYA